MEIKLKKKERSSNFSPNEIDKLLDLAVKHSGVIECKKTDAATWRDKELEWNKLTQEFNSTSPGSCPRTMKNLKTKYECLKKEVRKKKARQKQEAYKTGGGECANIVFTPTEEKLLGVISLSVEGLPVRNDSDNKTCSNETFAAEIMNAPIVFEDEQLEVSRYNLSPDAQNCERINIISDTIIQQSDTATTSTAVPEQTWRKWTPAQIKKPPTKLSSIKKRVQTKAEAIEKVSLLSTSKNELLKLQIKSAEADLKIKEERAAAELEDIRLSIENKKILKKIRTVQLKSALLVYRQRKAAFERMRCYE